MTKYVRDTVAITQGDVTYKFSRPVSANRAPFEFRKAREQGLPSGSVIQIEPDEDSRR